MEPTDKPKPKFRTPGKKRKRQYGEGGLYQRADGMWVGALSLPPGLDGRRRRTPPVYSADREECKKKLEVVKQNLRDGVEPLPKKSCTVETWMWKWADIKKPFLAPNAFKVYKSNIRTLIIPPIGPVDLKVLTPDHVRFMLDYLRGLTKEIKQPDGTVATVPKYSTASIQVAYDRLNGALDDAMKQRPQLVRENVCRLVDRPTAIHEERGTHTAGQARQVLAAALAAEDPLVTLWVSRYMLALRQGELLGLREDLIDFDELTIDVSWQLQRLPLKQGFKNSDDPNRFDAPATYEVIPLYKAWALVRPKSKKKRLIPMPLELAVMLWVYLEGRVPNQYGLVWVSNAGGPIRSEDEIEAWYAAQDRAGVDRIEGHGSRHTANSLIRVDEATRMQLLGQSSAVTNRLYLHADLDRLRAGQDELAGLLLPEKIVPEGQRR